MSYRSEIAIRMTRKNYEAMMESLALLKKGEFDDFTRTLDITTLKEVVDDIEYILGDEMVNKDEEFVDFHFHSIKWCDFYPSVRFIEHFVKEIDDEEAGEPVYDFLEIGENTEDITEDYHTDTYPFGVCREITWN